MQDTYTRLVQAMELQFGRSMGPTLMARKLHIKSPQVVKNWEDRGVSKDGILRAHRYAGINPLFLETGAGEPLVSDVTQPPQAQDGARQCPPMDCQWPFEEIEITQWSSLPERTKGKLEEMLLTAMRSFEQSRQGAFQARA
jgi:hypothetical protein